MGDKSPLRNHHGLSEKSPAFCASDIKNVAERSQILEAHIILRAGEAVCQTGAVYVKGELILTADLADRGQLIQGIERAQLRRLGNVYHSGHDDMLVGFVLPVRPDQALDRFGGNLSGGMGERENLMPSGFNGTGLMDVYVSALRCNHALIGL